MHRPKLAFLALAAAIGLSACADDSVQRISAPDGAELAKRAGSSPTPSTYILVAKGSSLPPGLEKRIQEAGGRVQSTLSDIGVAVVVSQNPNFGPQAARIPNVQSVVQDVTIRLIDPPQAGALVPLQFGNPPASGDDDFFFDLQWGHDAIDAPEAWNATGEFGAGVRVCVLDTGIDADHPDLAPNLNTALSRSFVPGETPFVEPGFFFSHGTHVAGTIAAADNGFGIIGVAPEAELVSIKVLSEFTESGSFAGIIQGLVYAGTIGCDVANMSFGVSFPRSGIRDEDGNKVVNANELAALINATKRAATFAFQQGVTLIASAGNDALNRNRTADLINLMSDLPHVITVGAYGPEGWALNPFAPDPFFYQPAFYTNYGQRSIDVSAPGGNVDFGLFESGQVCTIVLTQPCWVFDLVFSTIADGWAWSAGTSMAAPHASGVAALIIGQHGGELHPAQVRSILIRTAEDIGKPGKDPFFGHGTVNAFFALTGTVGTPNTPSP